MKDEIKKILDILKDNIYVPLEDNREYKLLDKGDDKLLLDYITNLQEIEKEHKNCTRKHWQQKCAEHCANEMIYKSRNEKAIEDIDLVIELIKQQPTEDDIWILNRLNGFKYLLQGEDKE